MSLMIEIERVECMICKNNCIMHVTTVLGGYICEDCMVQQTIEMLEEPKGVEH